MFLPEAFQNAEQSELLELIHANPFATLITPATETLTANHIPFLLSVKDETLFLQGHLARPNPLVESLANGSMGLAIFEGTNHYISPNWYPSKKEHERVVPTWNYIVVHARGQLSLHDDADWKLDLVSRLTDKMESMMPAPWAVSDAPDKFIQQQLKAIVGIEMRIESLEGKWKLSQNKPPQDRQGVKEGLEQMQNTSAGKMASLMDTD